MPATNAPPTLDPCLDGLRAAAGPLDEVLVVERPAGAGPAAARNAGARLASREVLVFVDADVVVRPDALDRLREALHRDPSLVALFGSYDDAPAAPGLVSSFRNLLHHHVHQSSAGPATTFWAGLGAVRREAFEAAGGFDAGRYPLPSIEDVDLGARLAARGARIALDAQVQGKHLKRWAIGDMVSTDLLRRGAPWVALRLRSGSGSTALNLGWRHRMSALVCVLGAAGALRRPAIPAVAVLALVLLNRSFYALLARRLGPSGAVAGVALHGLHHLTAVAAVPLGMLDHLRDGPSRAL